MSEIIPIVVGGALTLIGGAGTEWLRDRRASSMSAEERRAVRKAQRDDLQRQTLIELQDALQRYVRGIGAASHFDEMTQRDHGKQFLLPDSVSDEIYAAQVLTGKLASRVADDEIRTWVKEAIEKGTVTVLPNPPEPERTRLEMADLALKAQEKLGAQIREL